MQHHVYDQSLQQNHTTVEQQKIHCQVHKINVKEHLKSMVWSTNASSGSFKQLEESTCKYPMANNMH